MAQTCFLFGAGPFYGLAAAPQPGDLILAADGGYRHCQAAGLRPDRVLGDFDSLGAPPEGVPADPFPVEKDDTDTMLGLKHALNQGCAVVHLYGCTGGRPDHTLANLQALGWLAQQGRAGYLYDENYVFTALCREALALPAREAGIFSLFCLGPEARGVTIRGGQYPLDRGKLSPFFPLGVSNHFQGQPVEIQVEEGCLLLSWELGPGGGLPLWRRPLLP